MSTTDMTNAISRILPEELMLLNGAHATNKDVLVTTRAVSARHKLNSLANLREVQSSLAFSIPTGYSSGTYGVDSLRSSTVTVCTTRRFRTTPPSASTPSPQTPCR